MDAGRYKWVVLAVGTAAQASTASYFLGLAAVTPALRAYYGTGVAGVGALIGVTSVGLIATLVAWGAATDRFGERGVMTVGLAGAALALGGAAFVLVAGRRREPCWWPRRVRGERERRERAGRAHVVPGAPARPRDGRAADVGPARCGGWRRWRCPRSPTAVACRRLRRAGRGACARRGGHGGVDPRAAGPARPRTRPGSTRAVLADGRRCG